MQPSQGRNSSRNRYKTSHKPNKTIVNGTIVFLVTACEEMKINSFLCARVTFGSAEESRTLAQGRHLAWTKMSNNSIKKRFWLQTGGMTKANNDFAGS